MPTTQRNAEPAAGGDAWDARVQALRLRVERALTETLPSERTQPSRLHAAMRYATLGGGKRLRACLVYASGTLAGARLEALDAAAMAVELVHAYSLVHDDLPCMDDDDLRRGKPSCHRAFDEASALLAGDALHSLAFELVASAPGLDDTTRVALTRELARAAGAAGMAGGQALDLAAVGRALDAPALEVMHRLKTGRLILAAVRLGYLTAGATPQLAAALDDYAQAVGLAFQIVDDVLDVDGEVAALGKRPGADAARGKPTYATLLGVDGARTEAAALVERALASLARLGDNAGFLTELARRSLHRAH